MKRNTLVESIGKLFQKNAANDDMDILKNQIRALQNQMEENSLEEYLTAFKGVDDGGSGSSNTMNYFNSIETDLDIGMLQRLFVSEGWFYITVFTLSKTIGALPIKIEKRKITEEPVDPSKPELGTTPKESWIEATGSAEQIMLQYPNDLQPSISFYWLILIDLLSTGNCFIYVDKGAEAIPIKSRQKKLKAAIDAGFFKPSKKVSTVQGLYRMNPALTMPLARIRGRADETGFLYNGMDGSCVFSSEEVIHIQLPNPVDPFLGLAPIVPVFKNVLLDRYSTEHMIRFYKNGARLGGVIQAKHKLSKDQLTRLQRSFDSDYTGRHNHHRTLILPQDMEYKSIEQNPGETSLLEFCKANREPILSAYNVPPIKVGLLDGATFANALVQQKVFFVDTITPILTLIEQSLNHNEILLPADGNLRMKFDLSGIEALQDNQSEKAETGKKLVDAGWTYNEVRQELWKKQPLKGGDKSPGIEKMNNGGGAFPIFGSLSADTEEMETKEGGSMTAAQAMANLTSTQVTSVMNVCRRVMNDQLKPEAALAVLTSMFSIPESAAREMVGLPAKEQKSELPQQQPDSNVVTDIIPTNITFEQRVQQLIQLATSNGFTLEQATQHAIAQATLEGYKPTTDQNLAAAPQGNNQTSNEQKVDAPETIETQVGTAPIKPIRIGEEDDYRGDKGNGDNPDGSHVHSYDSSSTKTKEDGNHTHVIVMPDGSEVSVEESGAHVHLIPAAGAEHQHDGGHNHIVDISGQKITLEGGVHTHQFLGDKTPKSGEHIHTLTLNDGTTLNTKPAQDFKRKARYQGVPATKEQVKGHWKNLSAEGVKSIVENRSTEVKSFFSSIEKLVLSVVAKSSRQSSKIKAAKSKEIDELFKSQQYKELLESQIDKSAMSMEEAAVIGFTGDLVEFNLKFPNERAAKILRKTAAKMVTYASNTTKAQIRDIVSKGTEEGRTTGEISQELRDYFDGEKGMTAARAQTITRTETLTGVSLGQDQKTQEFKREYPELKGKLLKVWITAQDERVRGEQNGEYPDSEADHAALEGEVVKEEDSFSNGLKFPRDPDGKANETINCRCSYMTFLAEDKDDVLSNIEDQSSPMANVDEGAKEEKSAKGGPGSGRKPGSGKKEETKTTEEHRAKLKPEHKTSEGKRPLFIIGDERYGNADESGHSDFAKKYDYSNASDFISDMDAIRIATNGGFEVASIDKVKMEKILSEHQKRCDSEPEYREINEGYILLDRCCGNETDTFFIPEREAVNFGSLDKDGQNKYNLDKSKRPKNPGKSLQTFGHDVKTEKIKPRRKAKVKS